MIDRKHTMRRSNLGVSRALRIGLAAVLLLAVGARYGPWRPARLTGGSMAPRLLGPRWTVRCDDCRFPFGCGAEVFSDEWPVACPNCGARQIRSQATRQPGQRVWMDHRYMLGGAPNRWEIVALRSPDGPLVVKRLIGLPGERVAVRGGDVWIDGRRPIRSLAQVEDTFVAVHDDRFRPAGRRSGWIAEDPLSLWRQVPGGYDFPVAGSGASGSASDAVDWLVFQPVSLPADKDLPAMITDDCGYNQHLMRSANRVEDLLLTCHVVLGPDGFAAVRVAYRGRQWIVLLDRANGRLRLSERPFGKVCVERPWPVRRRRTDGDLAVAACDGRLLVGWDGRELIRYAIADPPETVTAKTDVPLLAIGGRYGPVQVRRIRVLRDLYYEPWPAGAGQRGRTGVDQWQLGADEFFLVGDNCPLSCDSRAWHPAVRRSALVGRVYADVAFPPDIP